MHMPYDNASVHQPACLVVYQRREPTGIDFSSYFSFLLSQRREPYTTQQIADKHAAGWSCRYNCGGQEAFTSLSCNESLISGESEPVCV